MPDPEKSKLTQFLETPPQPIEFGKAALDAAYEIAKSEGLKIFYGSGGGNYVPSIDGRVRARGWKLGNDTLGDVVDYANETGNMVLFRGSKLPDVQIGSKMGDGGVHVTQNINYASGYAHTGNSETGVGRLMNLTPGFGYGQSRETMGFLSTWEMPLSTNFFTNFGAEHGRETTVSAHDLIKGYEEYHLVREQAKAYAKANGTRYDGNSPEEMDFRVRNERLFQHDEAVTSGTEKPKELFFQYTKSDGRPSLTKINPANPEWDQWMARVYEANMRDFYETLPLESARNGFLSHVERNINFQLTGGEISAETADKLKLQAHQTIEPLTQKMDEVSHRPWTMQSMADVPQYLENSPWIAASKQVGSISSNKIVYPPEIQKTLDDFNQVAEPIMFSAPAPLETANVGEHERLKFVKELNGSTHPILVEDQLTGKLYVRKTNADADFVRNEYNAIKTREAMGVGVPQAQLFESADGPVLLTEYVHGELLGAAKAANKDGLLNYRLAQDFVSDVLMADYDVMSSGGGNVIIPPNGLPQRIDNGGTFDYSARGRLNARGQQKIWTADSVLKDIQTLRDPAINPGAAEVYGHLRDQDIISQINGVRHQIDGVKAAMPPEKFAIFEARLDKLEIHYGIKPAPKVEEPLPYHPDVATPTVYSNETVHVPEARVPLIEDIPNVRPSLGTHAVEFNLEATAIIPGRPVTAMPKTGFSRTAEMGGAFAPLALGGIVGGVGAAIDGKSGKEILLATGAGALDGGLGISSFKMAGDKKETGFGRVLAAGEGATAATATVAGIASLTPAAPVTAPVAAVAGVSNLGLGLIRDGAYALGLVHNPGLIGNTFGKENRVDHLEIQHQAEMAAITPSRNNSHLEAVADLADQVLQQNRQPGLARTPDGKIDFRDANNQTILRQIINKTVQENKSALNNSDQISVLPGMMKDEAKLRTHMALEHYNKVLDTSLAELDGTRIGEYNHPVQKTPQEMQADYDALVKQGKVINYQYVVVNGQISGGDKNPIIPDNVMANYQSNPERNAITPQVLYKPDADGNPVPDSAITWVIRDPNIKQSAPLDISSMPPSPASPPVDHSAVMKRPPAHGMN